MNTFTVYCITKTREKTTVIASSEEKAIKLAEYNPDDFDWTKCGETENEYEAE